MMKRHSNANANARRWLSIIPLLALALAVVPATQVLAGGEKAKDKQGMLDEAVLHSKVRMALLGDLGVDALGIDVDVRARTVTLSGVVDKRETHELARDVVKEVEGVEEINDDIRLDKASYEKSTTAGRTVEEGKSEVSDGILASRVYMHLLDALGAEALEIDVDAADGKVLLYGKVESDEHRDIAARQAREVEGVDNVENNLKSKS